MAYSITTQYAGATPIANTDATQRMPVGTLVRAFDPLYGEGEFIYLLGVANTTVGSVVTYSGIGATALAAIGTNLPQPIAIAMSANVATQYGWYQISGNALAQKAYAGSLTAGVAVGVSTIGFVAASSTGTEIEGALVVANASASTSMVEVIINRPCMQGRIT